MHPQVLVEALKKLLIKSWVLFEKTTEYFKAYLVGLFIQVILLENEF
jgi:hypothetical protein